MSGRLSFFKRRGFSAHNIQNIRDMFIQIHKRNCQCLCQSIGSVVAIDQSLGKLLQSAKPFAIISCSGCGWLRTYSFGVHRPNNMQPEEFKDQHVDKTTISLFITLGNIFWGNSKSFCDPSASSLCKLISNSFFCRRTRPNRRCKWSLGTSAVTSISDSQGVWSVKTYDHTSGRVRES